MLRSVISVLIASALVIMPFIAGGAVASDIHPTKNTISKTVVDSNGMVFEVSFDEKQSKILIKYENPTERGTLTGFVLRVDKRKIHDVNLKISASEQGSRAVNITSGINVNKNEHKIVFSTLGNHTQFNFTRKINSANPGPVPTPYISDVTIENGIAKGEPSAVANVTIVNPSEQLYSTKLFVHTTETDGSLYPASVRPGNSRTITVELLDERGSKIGGEARLYTGNLTTRDGAMDQVEFVGQAGESTSTRNVSYEPVRPTWMNDHYQYRNDSLQRSLDEKLSRGHEVMGVPAVYLVGSLMFVVGLLRKFR